MSNDSYIIKLSGSDYTYVKSYNPISGTITTTENEDDAIIFNSIHAIEDFLNNTGKFILNGYKIEGRIKRKFT